MNLNLQRAVVEQRENVAYLEAAKKEIYDRVQQIAANIEVFSALELAKSNCAQAETALREAALREYAVFGDKQPLPGCAIRVSEKLVYPVGQAELWANDHRLALKLDVKEFEKLMGAQTTKPLWVSIEKQVTATIAQDMAGALGGVGE